MECRVFECGPWYPGDRAVLVGVVFAETNQRGVGSPLAASHEALKLGCPFAEADGFEVANRGAPRGGGGGGGPGSGGPPQKPPMSTTESTQGQI